MATDLGCPGKPVRYLPTSLKEPSPAVALCLSGWGYQIIVFFVEETIDAWGPIDCVLFPGNISDKIQTSYHRHLFAEPNHQDFPDTTRFVTNGANAQSGTFWRLTKPCIHVRQVGEGQDPAMLMVAAVDDSSASPLLISLIVMNFNTRGQKRKNLLLSCCCLGDRG